MANSTISPDGKWIWTGSEWIPAPPTDGNTLDVSLQDSVVGGDLKITQNIGHSSQCEACEAMNTICFKCIICGDWTCEICNPESKIEYIKRSEMSGIIKHFQFNDPRGSGPYCPPCFLKVEESLEIQRMRDSEIAETSIIEKKIRNGGVIYYMAIGDLEWRESVKPGTSVYALIGDSLTPTDWLLSCKAINGRFVEELEPTIEIEGWPAEWDAKLSGGVIIRNSNEQEIRLWENLDHPPPEGSLIGKMCPPTLDFETFREYFPPEYTLLDSVEAEEDISLYLSKLTLEN